MDFQHSAQIWRDFPALVPGVLYVEGITADVPAGSGRRPLRGRRQVAARGVAAESELPEIQAWRRAFASHGPQADPVPLRLGVAAAAVPQGGEPAPAAPLVDLCNAVSLAFAIPVAVLDASPSPARSRCGTRPATRST